MPQLQRLLPRLLGHASQEHALVHLQEVVVTLVDDAPGHATVHLEGEVLHDTEQLDSVVLAIIEDLVAEHGADRIVTNIIGHSDATPGEEIIIIMFVDSEQAGRDDREDEKYKLHNVCNADKITLLSNSMTLHEFKFILFRGKFNDA